MGAPVPPMQITIKLHPRYVARILEALALAEATIRASESDRFSKAWLAADYLLVAQDVGAALGEQIVKSAGHKAWGRWMTTKIMIFAMKAHWGRSNGGDDGPVAS